MRNGQIADQYEGHTTCVTVSGEDLHCLIMIIGTRKSVNEEVNGFVVVLIDETEIMTQQVQAEEAKQKSETLLYKILPRNVVASINSGIPCTLR